MKKLFFLASLISLACISCKSKKETVKSADNKQNTVQNTSDSTVKYRIILSFTSKASGPDEEKRKQIMTYIESHPKKPAYSVTLWGREGEFDYNLTLSELKSKKEEEKFIEDIKKIIGGSDMVHITENSEKLHQIR